MPGTKKSGGKPPKRPIERYEHTDKKRINNPPVGLVTPETDPVAPTHNVYDHIPPVPSVKPRQELDYDPHLDPQLVWAGKKEHSSFEVSAAARERIAAAQRARWAKVRRNGGQKHNVVNMPKKKTMSAAARKKIAAAQRARWAKVKAAQKKSA